MNHTKEPWSIHHTQPTFIRAADGRKHVGNTDSMGEQPSNEANARRIVACVNACSGIPTEGIEAISFAVTLREMAECQEQRDELLVALEGVRDLLGFDWLRNEFDTARSAIDAARKSGAGTTATEAAR